MPDEDDDNDKALNSRGGGKVRGKVKRERAPDQDVLPGILGKQLRAAYSEMLNAPVPDAITELIKRLESQESGTGTAAEPEEGREESGR